MTGGVREQLPVQKLPQSANADSSLREGASLRNGGSKRAIPSSQEKALQGFFVICVTMSWGSFLENALCFLSFLSPCHGGVFLKNAPHSMRFQAAG